LKKQRAGIKRLKKSIKKHREKENVKLLINKFPVKKPAVPFQIEDLYSDD